MKIQYDGSELEAADIASWIDVTGKLNKRNYLPLKVIPSYGVTAFMHAGKPAEIKVFISGRDSVCDECDAGGAVVLKWSRARAHYERQGILVGETALERAEQECLADTED